MSVCVCVCVCVCACVWVWVWVWVCVHVCRSACVCDMERKGDVDDSKFSNDDTRNTLPLSIILLVISQ